MGSDWYNLQHFADHLRDMSNRADEFILYEEDSLMAVINRVPDGTKTSKELWRLSAALEDLAGEFDSLSDDMAIEDP